MIVQIYEVQNSEEAMKLVELGVDHIGVLVGLGDVPDEINYEDARRYLQLLKKLIQIFCISAQHWKL